MSMKGLIMDYPLTLTQFFERTRKIFHRKTMATRVPGVGLWRYTYADYADRVCRLSAALGQPELGEGGGEPADAVGVVGIGVAPEPDAGHGPPHRQHPPLAPGHHLHHQSRR